MRSLKTAREVVDALGGIAAVRKMTGANLKAVYYWTGQSHAFPARYFKMMNDALKRRGYRAPPHLWVQYGYEKDAA